MKPDYSRSDFLNEARARSKNFSEKSKGLSALFRTTP